MTKPLPHISVCICTYKRPVLLQRLLEKLAAQVTDGQFDYSIVVVDNDSQQSAKPVVTAFNTACAVPITYCSEPQQNIALARNKALGNAKGDYIAFIDDDEFPIADWLRILLETCIRTGADGVLGPVVPYFENEPPGWVKRGMFFDRPRHETGFKIDWNEGRTGNVLFNRRVFDGLAPAFRSEFGSGGEDRDLFKRMIAQGRTFVWCDEAVAYELVPPVRWNRRFMIRRALLRGRMSLMHRHGITDLAKSVGAVLLYTLALPFVSTMGHHVFLDYLIRICDHAGKLLAFIGIYPIREKYVTE